MHFNTLNYLYCLLPNKSHGFQHRQLFTFHFLAKAMHFRTVNADGSMGHLRDTLLSFAGESHEIAFVADNPGDWAFHCHMLSHAASGMMTWIRVQA